LKEACSICNLSLETFHITSYEEVIAPSERPAFGPVQEWIFRWLLKQLNGKGLSADSPSLCAEAWALLRYLLTCLPHGTAAKALKANSLITVLADTLTWLSQHGKFRSVPLEKSKKRKWRDDDILNLQDSSANSTFLLLSMHLFLHSMKTKVDYSDQELNSAFAAENLRSTVMASPNVSAEILAKVLSFVPNIPVGNIGLAKLIEVTVPCFLWLWHGAHGVSGQGSDEADLAFSSTCFHPALELLSLIGTTSDRNTRLELEVLVANHCIAPAREIFLAHRSPKDREPKNMHTLLSKYFASLSKLNDPVIARGTFLKLEGDGVQSPAAALLDLAARSYSRSSLQQRTIEDTWLCTVLFYVLSIFSMDLSVTLNEHETIATSESQKAIMRQCLQVCAAHGVRVDRRMLERICICVAQLKITDERRFPWWNIDWRMVGLCIRIDPEIAVVRSSENQSSVSKAMLYGLRRTPYLEAATTARSLVVAHHNVSESSSRENKHYLDAAECVLKPMIDIQVRYRTLPSFVDTWMEQLRLCYMDKECHVDSGHYPNTLKTDQDTVVLKPGDFLWDDEILLARLSEDVESNMTDKQIKDAFSLALTSMDAFQPRPDESALVESKILSALVVLIALLGSISRTSCIDMLEEHASHLAISLKTIVSMDSTNSRMRCLAWHLSCIVLRQWPGLCLSANNGMWLEAMLGLASGLQQRELSHGIERDEYTSKFWSFKFIQGQTYAFDEIASPRANSLKQQWNSSIQTLIKTIPTSTDIVWYGHVDEIAHAESIALACATVLILEPATLQTVQSDLLEQLLHAVYDTVYSIIFSSSSVSSTSEASSSTLQASTSDSPPFSWVRLWEDHLLTLRFSRDSKAIDDAFKHVLCKRFLQDINNEKKEKDSLQRQESSKEQFAIANLVSMGCVNMSRGQRTTIENALHENMVHLKDSSDEAKITSIQLLDQLLCCDSYHGFKCLEDPVKYTWCIVESFLGSAEADPHLATLARVVLNIARNATASQEEGIVKDALKKARRVLTDQEQSTVAMTWICSWIRSIHDYDLSKKLRSRLDELEKDAFEVLSNRLEAVDMKTRSTIGITHTVELLSLLNDLAKLLQNRATGSWCPPNLAPYCRSMVTSLRDADQSVEASESVYRIILKLELLLYAISGSDQSRPSALVDLSRSSASCPLPLAIDRACQAYSSFAKFSAEEQAQYLTELTKNDAWLADACSVFMLRKVLGAPVGKLGGDKAVLELLRSVLRRMITALDVLETPELCQLVCNAINATFRNNPALIAQYHIDWAITKVALMTTASCDKLPSGQEKRTYKGLCMVVGAILTVHYKRLEGHRHLLIQALQGLLHCLYAAYGSDSQHSSSSKIPHPSWIDIKASPTTKEQAGEWSRLVTTFCDPPASAVKRSGKGSKQQELNDATKKARREAGTFMANVLEEYCRLQLDGRLEPKVRAALNPGLYAIFDAMGHSVRGALNARLSPPARAVFRAAHEDWKRFGKWEGK
jgi:hypothetical protein